jgi:AcrR family transcriptional regulator
MFRQKGYAATTTRELSTLVGIQNATLYHYIPTKETLLYRLCLSTVDSVHNALVEASNQQGSAVSRLRFIVRHYLKVALSDRDKLATLLVEMRALTDPHRAEIMRRVETNVGIVRETIGAAQRDGDIRGDLSSKNLALALFNLLNWTIFWYSPRGELTPDGIADLLSTVFFEGVRREGAGSGRRRLSEIGRKQQLRRRTGRGRKAV